MRRIIVNVLLLLVPVINNARVVEYESKSETPLDFYDEVKLADIGLSKDVFDLAVKGLKKLETIGQLENPNIVTIADYSQSCNKKRLYVIDLKNRKLLFNTYVAHGRNTGDEFAKSFSNEPGSLKSSIGFFVTEKPIIGPHTGYALLIDGVEKGYNDNAIKREIIIHSAEYATESFIKNNGRLGRSLGCPVLPPDLNKPIIETIQGGTCLFIYQSIDSYLCNSTLLN